MLDLDHIKKLSPAWFGAIAGAAVAGAALVPGHKLVAGAIAAAGMTLVALKLTPCCDGCAQGVGCGGAQTSPTAQPQGTASSGNVLGALTDAGPAPSAARLFEQQQTVATGIAANGGGGCS